MIADKNDITAYLREHLLQDEDVVIFLGAGDIGRLAKEIVAEEA